MCTKHLKQWKACEHASQYKMTMCTDFPTACLGPKGTKDWKIIDAWEKGSCYDCKCRAADPNPTKANEYEEKKKRKR